ncbi:MAG: hypothetical protein ACOC1P_02845 [Minisyncoccales bacterium]
MSKKNKRKMNKFPILLYKVRNCQEPEIYLEDEDTLVWSGIGGEVTLSINDMKRWIKQAERKLKEMNSENE